MTFINETVHVCIIYSQVRKQDVDSFTPNNVPVPFNVRVQWNRDENDLPKPLFYEIKLHGAKEGFDFLTVTSPPLSIGMCYL